MASDPTSVSRHVAPPLHSRSSDGTESSCAVDRTQGEARSGAPQLGLAYAPRAMSSGDQEGPAGATGRWRGSARTAVPQLARSAWLGLALGALGIAIILAVDFRLRHT